MAVPKRRSSKARTRTRRSTKYAVAPSTVECPRCHAPRLPHRVCMECGTYASRQAIQVADTKSRGAQ